ncbi:MAG: PEP-CTERM sorting domain-containing protein [Verrucomicrobiae bacterium]|nr:PEP-CTERM sorting domain-containing protein [Verrucomicrobiae bacterium]
MTKRSILYSCALSLALPLSLPAATIGVTTPDGWTRGEADTAHVSFDVFTATEGAIGSTTDGFSSSGLATASLAIVGGDTDAFGPLLFGDAAPADNRIYTADEPVLFSLAINVPFPTNYAFVQIVEHGGPNGFDSVSLGGFEPSFVSSELFATEGKMVWRYGWDTAALGGGLAAGDLEVLMNENAIGHLSFDSVTADFSSHSNAIPEPSTAVMVLLGGLGLTMCRGRRRS